MSASTPVLDPSVKRWLAVFTVTLLVSLTVITHHVIKALAPASRKSAPVLQATPPKPLPVPRPVSWPEVPVYTPPLSEAQRKSNYQHEVHEQANYLRQLSKQYPKTASLPTPEQIGQLEKEGRMVE
jgi:hypothetical protein